MSKADTFFSLAPTRGSQMHAALVDRNEQPPCTGIGSARHHHPVVVFAGAHRVVFAVELFEGDQVHIVRVCGIVLNVEKRIVEHKGNGGQARSLAVRARQIAFASHVLEGVEPVVGDAGDFEQVEKRVVLKDIGQRHAAVEGPAGAHRVAVERGTRQLLGDARPTDVECIFGGSCVFHEVVTVFERSHGFLCTDRERKAGHKEQNEAGQPADDWGHGGKDRSEQMGRGGRPSWGWRCARLACTKLRLCFRLYKLRRAFYSRNAQFDEKIQLCDVLCRTEISPCLPAAAERIPLFFACRLASVRLPAANPKHHPCTAVNDALSRVRVSGGFRFFPSLLHPLCAIG